MKYAGFWRRFIAILIDSLIFGAIQGIGEAVGFREAFGGANIIISWLYFSLLQSSSRQATIGKMVMGLKVVDEDGERITFQQATIRYFSKILSAIILMIGYIMAAFSSKKQALHDKLASTYVIIDRS